MLNIPTKADGVDTLSATEFNSLNNELKNIIESTGQALAGGDLFQMAKSAATYAGSGTFYTDSGSTNSYVLSAIDSLQTIDAYADGLTIRFVATTENTGAATVNVNSLGAKSIVTSSGVALPSADIVIGDYITARYDVGNDNFLVEPAFSKMSSNVGKNLIINGDFSVWQRGITQTSDNYGSDDRFNNQHGGSSKVASQQTFTLGQTDVPNNPKFYSRTVVTSSAGASNYVNKYQAIEDVRKLSGKTITLSFWAKADSAKDIAVDFMQHFGVGGFPSDPVNGLGVTTFSLTSSWVKQVVTVTLPSITGKVIGSDDDSYTRLTFWFDAGSTFNSRTNSLGQQSGTFDISNVQIELGTVATDFEFISPADQLAECKRYFERITGNQYQPVAHGFAFSTILLKSILFFTEKRAFPSITKSNVNALAVLHAASTEIYSTTSSFTTIGTKSARLDVNTTVVTMTNKQGATVLLRNSSDWLDIDAEF